MEIFTDWQKDMIAWLCTTHSDAELSVLFKNKFGVERTAGQFFAWRKNHKIKSGRTGHFHTAENPNAHRPPKGAHFCHGTEFRKGNVPHNYKPVGSEAVSTAGYTVVKVSNTGTQRERWAFKSRLTWERTHGKLKPGEVIVHIDGDRSNDRIENLRKISNAAACGIKRAGGLKNSREINSAVISVCEIEAKIAGKKEAK